VRSRDVLVNNAGHSSKRRNVRWVEQDDWTRGRGEPDRRLRLTQAVLPSMIERGGHHRHGELARRAQPG
jgi:NADP-dependent 3-hydroxy acid dehydrogenase YdfG